MTQVKMLDTVGSYKCDSLQKLSDQEAERLISTGQAELVKQFWVDEPAAVAESVERGIEQSDRGELKEKPSKRK